MIDSTENQEYFSAIVSSAQDAIIGETLQGVIVSWNEGAERLFGYRAVEAIDQPVRMLHGDEGADEWTSLKRQIMAGERIPPFETASRRKDGTSVRLSVAASPVLGADGRLVGISCIARATAVDTEQEESRHQRERRERELIHLSRLSAMGQMATALAHELNQPLTAITTYLTAARHIATSDENNNRLSLLAAMDKAMEQAVRAARIIRHLRSFVSPGEAERQPVSVEAAIRDAGALVSLIARQLGVRMDIELASNSPVTGDPIQIQQVLFNLMRNAVEAMADTACRELVVSTTRRNDRVIIRVADTGPGLSKGVAARLFEPFVTTKPDGMGVGLSICRLIIDAHGGELWLEANGASGAVFCFSLPVASGEKTPLRRS